MPAKLSPDVSQGPLPPFNRSNVRWTRKQTPPLFLGSQTRKLPVHWMCGLD